MLVQKIYVCYTHNIYTYDICFTNICAYLSEIILSDIGMRHKLLLPLLFASQPAQQLAPKFQ